jgi:DNA-binding PadR family transcriptional regulator
LPREAPYAWRCSATSCIWFGFFWAATHQQIYRTLRAMEGDGWVPVTPLIQHGRPDKKVYTVSAAGRAEVARWIAEPLSGRGSSVADNRTRDLAVKVRGAAHGDVAAVHAQAVALRAERAELLDT